ncbi:hypothetical protein F5972_22145 [Microbispora cellulosiformans]|uniref:DUF320 domain-containing protein n=1 Tax=Microbispora cellulosiformans TaxID=2614688 RepID=A0A5J5K358_9ACTN|nr:hypothetical protein [Microbispora cellulosiformans]KAA9377126.1 hypothetical protein F5972_22145 [Microbispora cellulosiformans]
MIHRRGGAFLTGRVAGLLVAGASASTAFITGVAPMGAAADNGHDRAERNVVQSPGGERPGDPPGDRSATGGSTRNHGYQHTSANTSGGSSNVQNALCRRARVCNITQHVTIAGPRVTVSPSPPATPAAKPVPVPTVTVTVTMTPTPAPAPLTVPAAPCPAPRPLLSIDGRVGAGVGVGRGAGLLDGLLSLSLLGRGAACPG